MKHKLLFLTVIILMTACSSTLVSKTPDLAKMIKPETLPAVKKKVSPNWTMLKSGAHYDSQKNPVFYGLALVEKSEISQENETLSKDRARDELAKVFISYMHKLGENLLQTTKSSNDFSRSRLNSLVEERSATILMEAEITNHWSNPDNGKVYSMAKLDLSRLTGKLDSFEMVSQEDKSFLRNSITQVHASMTNKVAGPVILVEESSDVQPELDRLISY